MPTRVTILTIIRNAPQTFAKFHIILRLFLGPRLFPRMVQYCSNNNAIDSKISTLYIHLVTYPCSCSKHQASTLTFVRLSGTSEYWRRTSRSCCGCPTGQVKKIRTNPVKIIYFHQYKILGLLYKRALFDLQFVHNLFWLKLK